jgi:uncharacterized protein (UPF0333 family)
MSGDKYSVINPCVSLSADGEQVVVGNPNKNEVNVYKYDYLTNLWNQIGQTICGCFGEYFGHSVSSSADGNRLAIGAPLGYNSRGYVQVYEYNKNKNLWEIIHEYKLDEISDVCFIGWALSLSADGTKTSIVIPLGKTEEDEKIQTLVYLCDFNSKVGQSI